MGLSLHYILAYLAICSVSRLIVLVSDRSGVSTRLAQTAQEGSGEMPEPSLR